MDCRSGDREEHAAFGVASMNTLVPVSESTLFQIGSLTKTYTASADFDADSSLCGTDRDSAYIQIALTDKYTPMFPIHFAAFNGDGTYHMSATAGMRTE